MYHKKAGIILNRMLCTASIVVAYYIFGPFKDLIVTHPLKMCASYISLFKKKCFENRAFVELLHLDIILSNTVLLFTNTKV